MIEKLKETLKGYDTGRWDWDRIDCCLTGKDADLEPWGDQGIEITGEDEEHVFFTAHILKTFAGSDVSLNLPLDKEDDEAFREKALESYLEQAELTVCGCDVPGEWDGDDWVLSDAIKSKTPWIRTEDGEVDYEETARAVIKTTGKELEPIKKELALADEVLDHLAGWKDGEIQCESGKPGKAAAWNML